MTDRRPEAEDDVEDDHAEAERGANDRITVPISSTEPADRSSSI